MTVRLSVTKGTNAKIGDTTTTGAMFRASALNPNPPDAQIPAIMQYLSLIHI